MSGNSFEKIRSYLNRIKSYKPLIDKPVPLNLRIVIVIPALNEKCIIHCLNSLDNGDPIDQDVEVLLIVNDYLGINSEAKQQNIMTVNELTEYSFKNPRLFFRMIYLEDLSKNNSGVGVARKVGMDEALHRLDLANQEDGIIVCLDADCCVEKNYLTAIAVHFDKDMQNEAFSIHFEHRKSNETNEFCQLYELHLRYYIEAQRYLRLPFAYQTIGSSMAVRAVAYAIEGGMPKKKAGEDFYFLHKFIRKGRCGEILNTVVYPSCRSSDRVPFGTGKAIGLAREGKPMKTYSLESFFLLKQFLDVIHENHLRSTFDLKKFEGAVNRDVKQFLSACNFEEKWMEIQQNTTSSIQFFKRFYQWFDAFLLMKYLHFMRNCGYVDVEIVPEALKLKHLLTNSTEIENLDSLLDWYRKNALRGRLY